MRASEKLWQMSRKVFQLSKSAQDAIEQMQSFRVDPAILQLESSMKTHQEALRIAIEPFESLKLPLAAQELMRVQTQFDEFTEIARIYQEQFRLPEIGEAVQLAAQMQQSMKLQSAQLAEAMSAIKTPWLDTANALRSAHSFTALQDIGRSITTLPGFGDEVTISLRNYLGDWREPITLADTIAEDIVARNAFYEARGFDTGLTDFPEPAFDEAIEIAGLAEALPEAQDGSRFLIPVPQSMSSHGFKRTNVAHDYLLRFEVHLRIFIEGKMRAEFGAEWAKHQIPGDMRESWLKKQEKAEAIGEEKRALISYADFTDYEMIIVRKDNWNAVFSPVFRQKTSIAESLRRLYPVRLSTMHARIITPDDELFLKAEVKRILKSIGVM